MYPRDDSWFYIVHRLSKRESERVVSRGLKGYYIRRNDRLERITIARAGVASVNHRGRANGVRKSTLIHATLPTRGIGWIAKPVGALQWVEDEEELTARAEELGGDYKKTVERLLGNSWST